MVDIKRDGDYLIAEFQVKTKELNTSDAFSTKGWKNDGLWDFDVVELFVRRESVKNRYLELEISPLGQKVAILVKRPREDFSDFVPKDAIAKAAITDRGFNAIFKILISDIPGKGNIVLGNAHACLGKDHRNYFSLFDSSIGRPDFHRPEFFQSVEEI